MAGPYVGVLPLSSGETLRIVPRTGSKVFWRMLLVSEGLADEIPSDLEQFVDLGFSDEGAAPWLSLLARSYFIQLRVIEKQSLRSDRVMKRIRSAAARGRIRLVETVMATAKRESLPVHCTFKLRTYDTKEHRVLAAAALRLLEIRAVEEENKNLAYRWIKGLKGRLKESELREVILGLRSRRYTGPRSYYIPALLMARLLLAEAGISLLDSPVVAAEAFLTNVRTIFERYVRAIIREALKDRGFIIEKREPSIVSLFDDGTCSLVPDVIVSDSKGIHLIADAKYKVDKAVQESDYYQMAVYLDTFNVSKGVLVLPAIAQDNARTLSHKTVSGRSVYEIRLPLDDWQSTEALLTGEVQRLIQ